MQTSSAPPPKKGSQLKQLKQSLKHSGLSRSASASSNPKNKKNKSSITKSLNNPDFRQKKLAEIQASQNLFDLKTSKIKFPTANQTQRQSTIPSRLGGPPKPKLIKTVGNPTQSATQAHQKRVEKLLPEYLNRHKSSQFLDKRFGETDSNLTPEEKALERFTREKQVRSSRARKRNVFNLDDEGEGLYDDGQFGDNTALTHRGRHLDLDDDDDARDDDDEDDENANDPESMFEKREDLDSLKDSDQGSDDDDQASRKKTKAEVMSEIITKSKAHKYQRQMIKEKDDELRDQLNIDLNQIRDLLFSSALPRPSKSGQTNNKPASPGVIPTSSKADSVPGQTISLDIQSGKPAANTEETNPQTGSKSGEDEAEPVQEGSSSRVDRALLESLIGPPSPGASSEAENEDEDAYDRFVRELAFDARARPTDRLKTAEEAALEEAERLRKLELQRLKRMRGEEDDDQDEGSDSGKKSQRNPKRRRPQADDLEDDFFPFEEAAELPSSLGKGLRPDGAFGAGALDDGNHEGSEEDSDDSDSGEEDETDDDSDSVDDDDDDVHHSGDGMKKTKPLVATKPGAKNRELKIPTSSAKNELAYTYPCPSSHADFLSILSSASVDSSDLPTVVQRIRVLYHPSLGEGNKEKLAIFTNVLIDHLIYASSQPLPVGRSISDLINSLLPHLVSLCKSHTQSAAAHFVSKLVLMHNNLTHALTHPETSGWPGGSELVLLRLIGLVWSTSDFSHPVAAPALLLINQYLHQLRVKHFADLSSGLFLCTLVLQYETHSKRFVPEVINFLVLTILRMAFTTEQIKQVKGMTPVIEGSELVLFPVNREAKMRKLQPKTMDFTLVFGGSSASSRKPARDQDLVDAFDVAISLLGNFSEVYGSLSQYPEVFSPVLALLEAADVQNVSEESGARMAELAGSMGRRLAATARSRALNPIGLQAHRPIPILSQQPDFDPHFNPSSRKFNPDSSLVEINKLKSLVKKEKKGAMRELRKDNKFLAAAKALEKDRADALYTSKMAKITASLQEERSEEKKAERLKLRLKKADKAQRRQ